MGMGGVPVTSLSLQSEDHEETQEAVRACSRLFGALLERGELFVGQLPSEDTVMAGERSRGRWAALRFPASALGRPGETWPPSRTAGPAGQWRLTELWVGDGAGGWLGFGRDTLMVWLPRGYQGVCS